MPDPNVISATQGGKRPGQMDFEFVKEPVRNPDQMRIREGEGDEVLDTAEVDAQDGFLSMVDKVLLPEDSDEALSTSPSPLLEEPEILGATSNAQTLRGGAIPQQLVGLDYVKTNSRWQLIRQLAQKIPRNEFDMPVFIYRPDLLDVDRIVRGIAAFYSQAHNSGTTHGPTPTTITGPIEHGPQNPGMEDIQAELNAARYMLDYSQGFPTAPDGTPFWRKLSFETIDAYNAFVDYLDIGGARKLSDLIAYPQSLVHEWFHIHYWAERVRAFDQYRIVNHQKMQIQRMLQTEDSHYHMSKRYLDKLAVFLDKAEFNDDNLSLDKAIGMMEKLVKIQRISVGLTANGEKFDQDAIRRDPSVQVVMQQITNEGGGGKTRDEVEIGRKFDQLMSDPAALEKAQELIIQMSRTSVTVIDDQESE